MLQKPDIILVDDHPVFRQVLKSIFLAENMATVIGEASNGTEFIKLLSLLKPDLVIMDIEMPVMNGIEATQKALKLMPDLKIIACTMFSDEEYYYKMIDLGVKGFILKSDDIREYEKAIKEVMVGKTFFPDRLRRIKNKVMEYPAIIADENRTIIKTSRSDSLIPESNIDPLK